jgi:hypothetical protein
MYPVIWRKHVPVEWRTHVFLQLSMPCECCIKEIFFFQLANRSYWDSIWSSVLMVSYFVSFLPG